MVFIKRIESLHLCKNNDRIKNPSLNLSWKCVKLHTHCSMENHTIHTKFYIKSSKTWLQHLPDLLYIHFTCPGKPVCSVLFVLCSFILQAIIWQEIASVLYSLLRISDSHTRLHRHLICERDQNHYLVSRQSYNYRLLRVLNTNIFILLHVMPFRMISILGEYIDKGDP